MELRIKLDEKLTDRFLTVKENVGMKSNTNIVRFLISKECAKIQESRYRKLFVAPETYDLAEKEAEAQGVTVEIYVTELVEKSLKKAKEGVKHGN